MRRFKSISQAQRFLATHGLIQNLFRIGRYILRHPTIDCFVTWRSLIGVGRCVSAESSESGKVLGRVLGANR